MSRSSASGMRLRILHELQWRVSQVHVQVEAAGDHPERVFRLDVSVTLPKWARVIDWTVRDDAMLLLGIYW